MTCYLSVGACAKISYGAEMARSNSRC